MNTFQRNFVFAISVLLSAGILVTGSLTAYSIYRESKTRAEQALIRKRVDRVLSMNNCAEFSSDERMLLEKQASDPDGTKRILMEIHIARANRWNGEAKRLMDVFDNYVARFGHDENSKKIIEKANEALEQAKGFHETVGKLKAHSVSDPFEDPMKAALRDKVGFK